jgi:hypothetical protein
VQNRRIHIEEQGINLFQPLKLQAKLFAFYAIAVEESNYNTDTEQLIFIRDIDCAFLVQMHDSLCILNGTKTGSFCS